MKKRAEIFSLVVHFFVCLGIVVTCSCCAADNNEGVRALENNGFSHVSITDSGILVPAFHGCDKHDGAYYEANATNPAGNQVHMTVCCGGPMSFKGCTVRSK